MLENGSIIDLLLMVILDRALRCLLLSLQNSVNRILATKQPNYL